MNSDRPNGLGGPYLLEIDPAKPPRLAGLQVSNYRVLRNVQIDHLTPLAAFVGPNGSGKSTLLDVLSFLAECFSDGVVPAVEARGGLRELRSRGSKGPVTFTVSYREHAQAPLMLYHLALDEDKQGLYVAAESLLRQGSGRRLLDFKRGQGYAARDDTPEGQEAREHETFGAPDVLAVSTFSRFARHQHLMALFRFLTDWYVANLQIDRIRSGSPARSSTRLSQTGDNLATVIHSLQEQYPRDWQRIKDTLTAWIPLLADAGTTRTLSGQLQVELSDAPFQGPILAPFASEGALILLAHLTVLYGPKPPLLVGLEEPDNFLHARLLVELAEACRAASDRPQVLVTTHSPFFINGLRPQEVWVLARDPAGYAQARRAADILGIAAFMEHGAQLGDLWMEGYFRVPEQSALAAPES